MNEALHHWAALANWAVCCAIGWACLCRLNSGACRASLRLRLRYVLLLAGALASGLQPLLWREWPGVGELLFSSAVLVNLLLNARLWESGPCPYKEGNTCTSLNQS